MATDARLAGLTGLPLFARTFLARFAGGLATRLATRLATGLATDRIPEDDIVVVTVHFTKDNGELSSVTLNENSRIEVISGS